MDNTSKFQKSHSTFDIDWLFRQIQNEVRVAEQKLIAPRNYTSTFPNTPLSAASGHIRPARPAPVAMMD